MAKKISRFIQEKDLYSSRRREYKTELFLLKSNKFFAISGLITGGVFVLIILFLSLLIFFTIIIFKNKNFQLQPYVDAFDKFQLEINKIKTKNKEFNLTNNRIIKDIINIKSGSSIIKEITLIIPKFISLNNLSLINNKIEFKGTVNQKNGLENINILIIKINQSEFFKSDATKLIQGKRLKVIMKKTKSID